MSNDKMREEFEQSPRFRGMDFQRAPEAPDYYLSPYANGAWDGWKASRAAVVVEPQWPFHHDYTNSDVAGAAVLDCRTAFEKAARAVGIKVKP